MKIYRRFSLLRFSFWVFDFLDLPGIGYVNVSSLPFDVNFLVGSDSESYSLNDCTNGP